MSFWVCHIFLFLWFINPSQPLFADPQNGFDFKSSAADRSSIPQGILENEISAGLKKVDEFQLIQKSANELGVRVFLFGGSASAYAHYVKANIEHRRGDPRWQAERFSYSMYDIFRTNQDLDLVVDGPAEKAAALKERLISEFPYLQGQKSVWDVRTLREKFENKTPLLEDKDFLSQNTDSHSTGLIELTQPKAEEPRIRDLMDWQSTNSQFIRDIKNGELHLYYSNKKDGGAPNTRGGLFHEDTSLYLAGRNPPILFAVRSLIKIIQYRLHVSERDREVIKRAIREFDPGKDLQNPYVLDWLKRNVPKLIQHATDVEYAVDLIESSGLSKALKPISGDKNNVGSIAYWFDKKPLRGKALGTSGRTAKEIGISIVSHETRSIEVFEALTRPLDGNPNALVSRETGGADETAAYGEGFYTRIGNQGARQTGLTIRYQLHPDAREGADFTLHGDFVIIQNRNAIRVIPETAFVGPETFFQLLSTLDESNKGRLELLRRKVRSKTDHLTKENLKNILAIVNQAIQEPSSLRSNAVLSEWFRLKVSAEYPTILEKALLKSFTRNEKARIALLKSALDHSHWENFEPNKGVVTSALRHSVIDFDHSAYIAPLLFKEGKPRGSGVEHAFLENSNLLVPALGLLEILGAQNGAELPQFRAAAESAKSVLMGAIEERMRDPSAYHFGETRDLFLRWLALPISAKEKDLNSRILQMSVQDSKMFYENLLEVQNHDNQEPSGRNHAEGLALRRFDALPVSEGQNVLKRVQRMLHEPVTDQSNYYLAGFLKTPIALENQELLLKILKSRVPTSKASQTDQVKGREFFVAVDKVLAQSQWRNPEMTISTIQSLLNDQDFLLCENSLLAKWFMSEWHLKSDSIFDIMKEAAKDPLRAVTILKYFQISEAKLPPKWTDLKQEIERSLSVTVGKIASGEPVTGQPNVDEHVLRSWFWLISSAEHPELLYSVVENYLSSLERGVFFNEHLKARVNFVIDISARLNVWNTTPFSKEFLQKVIQNEKMPSLLLRSVLFRDSHLDRPEIRALFAESLKELRPSIRIFSALMHTNANVIDSDWNKYAEIAAERIEIATENEIKMLFEKAPGELDHFFRLGAFKDFEPFKRGNLRRLAGWAALRGYRSGYDPIVRDWLENPESTSYAGDVVNVLKRFHGRKHFDMHNGKAIGDLSWLMLFLTKDHWLKGPTAVEIAEAFAGIDLVFESELRPLADLLKSPSVAGTERGRKILENLLASHHNDDRLDVVTLAVTGSSKWLNDPSAVALAMTALKKRYYQFMSGTHSHFDTYVSGLAKAVTDGVAREKVVPLLSLVLRGISHEHGSHQVIRLYKEHPVLAKEVDPHGMALLSSGGRLKDYFEVLSETSHWVNNPLALLLIQKAIWNENGALNKGFGEVENVSEVLEKVPTAAWKRLSGSSYFGKNLRSLRRPKDFEARHLFNRIHHLLGDLQKVNTAGEMIHELRIEKEKGRPDSMEVFWSIIPRFLELKPSADELLAFEAHIRDDSRLTKYFESESRKHLPSPNVAVRSSVAAPNVENESRDNPRPRIFDSVRGCFAAFGWFKK